MAYTFDGNGTSSSEASDSADDFDSGEFNPRKRRKIARDPKMAAALGTFYSESEDEDRSLNRHGKSRFKGVSFVSAGEKEVDEGIEDEDDEDEEDMLHRTGLGGWCNVQADDNGSVDERALPLKDEKGSKDLEENEPSSLGLDLSAGKQQEPNLDARTTSRFDPAHSIFAAASSPFGKGFVPSSAATPILRDDLRDERSSKTRVSLPSAFTTPTATKSVRGDITKSVPSANPGSFAARMMAKMGYQEGKGLGKDLSGRANVIEVQLRPSGVGVGAVREKSVQEKTEERRQAALRGEVLEDSDDEIKKKRQRKSTGSRSIVSGTNSGASTPKVKHRAKYQSLKDVEKAAPGLKVPSGFSNILDMTGPGQKLLTSSSGLLTPVAKAEIQESTQSIEARKLARQAQRDLNAFVEEWKNLEDRKTWIAEELRQQHQLLDSQQEQTKHLEIVAASVTNLMQAVNDGQWDPVIEALMRIEDLGIADNAEITDIAVSSIDPFFRRAVEGWQPLESYKLDGVPGGFATALHSIRHLLGLGSGSKHGSNGEVIVRDSELTHVGGRGHKTTAYESLMFTVWFPKIRSAITNDWDVYDPTPLLTFLEIWQEILPDFIRSQILDQLVVRKLDEAIEKWNPKKSRRHPIPLPHLWLFPWLQYLPSYHADPKSSTGLVSDVKRKFRQLVDAWDFNRGIIPGLEVWKHVLKPSQGNDQWTPLIQNHVLPNISKYLRANFRVAPQDQAPYLPVLENALLWMSVLGTRTMSQLIADIVFPMWLDVLHTWLTSDGVNYEQVVEWVEWWRSSVFTPDITNSRALEMEWARGRQLIQTALNMGDAAKTQLPAPQNTSQRAAKSTPTESIAPSSTVPDVRTIQQIVEDFSWSRDFQFLPQKSIMDANGPVYRITAAPTGKGGVLVYFKGSTVFAMHSLLGKSWTDLGGEETALDTLSGLIEGY